MAAQLPCAARRILNRPRFKNAPTRKTELARGARILNATGTAFAGADGEAPPREGFRGAFAGAAAVLAGGAVLGAAAGTAWGFVGTLFASEAGAS